MTTERREPAYQALATDLRTAILSGEFPPHRPLPTEAALAADRGVSRQTVRQAFAELVAESLVYRVRGRGTFAAPFSHRAPYLRSLGSVEELLALAVDTELKVIEPFERKANVEAAARLRLDSNEVIEGIVVRLNSEEAFCVTTVDMPVWVGQRLLRRHPSLAKAGSRAVPTIIGLIEREAATVPLAGAEQSITAVSAPPRIAEMMDCVPGEPVLRIDRLYFDREGTPLELAVMHANPVRYAYRLELRRGS